MLYFIGACPSFLQFSRHCLSISSSFILLIVIATGRSHSAREFAEKACLPNRVKDSYDRTGTYSEKVLTFSE